MVISETKWMVMNKKKWRVLSETKRMVMSETKQGWWTKWIMIDKWIIKDEMERMMKDVGIRWKRKEVERGYDKKYKGSKRDGKIKVVYGNEIIRKTD